MLEKIRRADYISSIDLLKAGYLRINEWKYVKKIDEKRRWHAIKAGRFIYLHQDTTWKTKFGLKKHQIAMSNVYQELKRIRRCGKVV
jgi:hypothetical protein